MKMDIRVMDTKGMRDIAPFVLDKSGRLTIRPAKFYEQTTIEERAILGVKRALYGLPTEELVAWLQRFINGRSAIEIGAGHGALAEALGIPATDNRMQEWPEIASLYASMRQPVIAYGPNVLSLDAHAAVDRFKPQVVIASWVTHRYDEARHEAGGNVEGVHEEKIIEACEAYVVIGNEHVHRGKSIWRLPHVKLTPPWLYSRAFNGSADFIAVWGKADNLPGVA